MTRKDYEVIASAVRMAYAKRLDQGDVNVLAECMADRLIQDDPRFDREKFYNSCGVYHEHG